MAAEALPTCFPELAAHRVLFLRDRPHLEYFSSLERALPAPKPLHTPDSRFTVHLTQTHRHDAHIGRRPSGGDNTASWEADSARLAAPARSTATRMPLCTTTATEPVPARDATTYADFVPEPSREPLLRARAPSTSRARGIAPLPALT
jgi:hypothetical protein